MSDFRPPAPERFQLTGPAGALEVVLEVPQGHGGSATAVVCHPHPLYGGTLQNKVVHMAARALQELGVATMRFNFRGVGESAGTFDEGRGETDDAVAVFDALVGRFPGSVPFLVGFSFGAFVAYQVATRRAVRGLITIAPPVRRFDFSMHPVPSVPWTVIQGDRDELVEYGTVLEWANAIRPAPAVALIPGAEHFFHGKLGELKAAVQRAAFPFP
jgi:uncharacterized protein